MKYNKSNVNTLPNCHLAMGKVYSLWLSLYISVNGSLGVQTSLFYSNFNHQVPPELNVNENNWLVMVNGRLQMVDALVLAHAKFDF